MDQRAAPPTTCAKALGQHADDSGKIFAPQFSVGPGATRQCEEIVLLPFPRCDLSDDLLRQNIERLRRDRQVVEFTATDAIEQGRTFDQLVARQREKTALGCALDSMARAADP